MNPPSAVVVTAQNVRRRLRKILMAEALRRHDALYPGVAESHRRATAVGEVLPGFGFETVSEMYIEDGIPHVLMLRTSINGA